MYDTRLIMATVHRYGEACRTSDYSRAGVLYSEIVRMIQDDEEAPEPSDMEDSGATVSAR